MRAIPPTIALFILSLAGVGCTSDILLQGNICEDDCSTYGEVRCVDDQAQVCDQFDDDDCLEWGAMASDLCEQPQGCQETKFCRGIDLIRVATDCSETVEPNGCEQPITCEPATFCRGDDRVTVTADCSEKVELDGCAEPITCEPATFCRGDDRVTVAIDCSETVEPDGCASGCPPATVCRGLEIVIIAADCSEESVAQCTEGCASAICTL